MTNKIREIIVYKVQSERLAEFQAIKAQMITESLTLPGLRSSTTAKLLGSDDLFADTMIWDSKAASEQAMPVFETLPTAGQFLSLFDGPPVQHFFMEYQADQVS